MKRAHDCDSSSQVRDDSQLGSRLHSDNDENKLPETSIVEETEIQQQQLDDFQNKTIPDPVDAMITELAIVDEKNTPKSNNTDDILEDTNKLSKKESKDLGNFNETKGELLLEAISSDDDIAMDSEEDGALDSDISDNYNEHTDDIIKEFAPSLFQTTPLRSIQDPSLSLFEFIHRKLGNDSKCQEVAELMDCLECLQSKTMEINEKWVITAERIVEILPKTLSHILNIPEYCHKLFSIVNITLDFTCASKEHVSMSTSIIRHLNVGFQLIEALCQYNEDLSEHLIKHHQIHNKLFSLFFIEHMSLSLKLNILRALDSSLNGSEPIRLFLNPGVFDKLNGYETLLKILSTHQRPRVCFLITRILKKIHFYELLQKLNSNILDLNSKLLLHQQLTEITTIYIKATILMGCPKRFLQARAQFELTPALTHSDVYPTIYRLFDNSSLISCITKILDKSNSNGPLEQNILNLLQSLINCDHGLRYLGCRHKELNELIKVLNKLDIQFKLTFIYKIKVLTLVDYLGYFWECNLMHNFKLDQMESVDILHDLFLLTQSTIGKCAVVNVLIMGDNLDVILNFFKYMEQSRSKSDDLHIMYSLDLMKIVLENAEDVSYLKKYGALIYELMCKHNLFNDLIAWTTPAMKHSTFFHDDVSDLCNIVKNNINNCLNFNRTLITCLRILKYLGIPPNDQTEFQKVEDFIELKYKYIILQMYSCDMLGNLLSIVDKICNSYKQPSLNLWKLTGNQTKNLIFIIRPSMVLIKYMITLLIQSRGNAFKDLSSVKPLLKLYGLMHYVPECSIIYKDATRIANDVSKILETYIEIKSGSLMLKEVIDWTLSSPSVFYPGMLLLCKLLPSPLPIQVTKSLNESVVKTMNSFRNMWIDHLTIVNNDLIELITVLSSSILLLQTVKCLCIKIADLSVPMCLFVAQTLLDALVNADNNDCFDIILDLLTQLCNNKECAAIKTAIIQILNEEKSQINNDKFVQRICENIKNNEHEKSILFVQYLCDSSNILISDNCAEKNLLKDSIPNSWFLNNILTVFFNLLESSLQFSTLSLVFKTFIVIIKNDYGFYQFKIVLDTFSKPFYNIFNNLLQKWNKEDIHCVNTLLFSVQFLNLCAKNDINTKRVLFLNTSQLKECVNWSNNNEVHPISLLRKITQEQSSICHQNLVELLELLSNDQNSIIELVEPQLIVTDSLAAAFKDRKFYIVNANNENHQNFISDLSSMVSVNLKECNIEEIALDLPDFNIKEKINGMFVIENCLVQPDPIMHKQQEPIVIKKKENSINQSAITTTPIRHKVFSRLGTVQRPDAFRNRLPNTSRPPSLHVDDFVAMETRNAQIQQPSRYKLPIQPIQDLNIRLRERQMAYERTYNLFSPYKSHLSLHNWHAQFNALAQLRADYRQTITNRHLELQRHSLVAEWRQLRVEAALRKKRAYSRR